MGQRPEWMGVVGYMRVGMLGVGRQVLPMGLKYELMGRCSKIVSK